MRVCTTLSERRTYYGYYVHYIRDDKRRVRIRSETLGESSDGVASVFPQIDGSLAIIGRNAGTAVPVDVTARWFSRVPICDGVNEHGSVVTDHRTIFADFSRENSADTGRESK